MFLLLSHFLTESVNATTPTPVAEHATVDLGMQKIFAMFFLMLGPFKVIGPFIELTRLLERRQQVRIATSATFFSAVALFVAGALGQQIIENFDISVPVVALTGGLILFLMALQSVLAQSNARGVAKTESTQAARNVAISPLAFPIIVTPYGLAAVIVFATLAQGDGQLMAKIGGTIVLILAVDWITMVYAISIQKWLGTTLQIVAVVLGVVQVALGLQVIFKSLAMLGVL